MEQLNISLDPKRYDEIVRGSGCPPEHGDLELAFKTDEKHGTPLVAITFTVDGHDGPQRVQAVTTLKLLRGAVQALSARAQMPPV